jgi:signal transduction histidine kinase/ActR/RegA family two-component response regulator
LLQAFGRYPSEIADTFLRSSNFFMPQPSVQTDRPSAIDYVAVVVVCAVAAIAQEWLLQRTGFRLGPPIWSGGIAALWILHLRRLSRLEGGARLAAERRLRETDQLQQLTAILSRARTPHEAMRACLPDLLYATEAAAGAIALVSDDGADCDIAHAIGYDDDLVERARRRSMSSRSAIVKAIRRREIVAVRAPAAFDDLASPHQALVIAPLLAGGRALGATVMSFNAPRRVDDEEAEFLLTVGRHIAQALDRASLYDTAERARAEAERLRRRADAALRDREAVAEALRLSEAKYRSLAARTSRLHALSAGLSEAATPAALARVMVARGKLVVGAAAGSVCVPTSDGRAFDWLYAEEYGSEERRPQTFPAEPGLCATAAVQTRQAILIGSFDEWQEKYPRSASIAADGGFASAATLPLIVDTAVVGVLSFYFAAPVNFDEEYRSLLTSLAQHCAQALDRARLYDAADRARAEAETANRSKDDFLSTISHELRTPLNAILGWAAMLRAGTVDPARMSRAVEAIFNNASRQGRLIEDLLDVSRIVAGRATIDVEELDLGENLRGAVESMMPAAEASGIELRFQPPSDLFVKADARRLEQVFLNLLSNALKFTPAGGSVTIDAERVGSFVDIRVRDTGAGIEPEFLPHVFERFRQGDSTTTRSVGGLGLGLFIARHLVEAQHGHIAVSSDGPGRGSTFTVTLPSVGTRARPAGRSAPGEDAARTAGREGTDAALTLSGIRVLVVDDEADAREMMAAALESCGATVTIASSANAALDALKRAPVDVLLADIAMPDRDGYELIREVRQASTARIAAVPAAAVTACVREDERERAIAAGFHLHLAKPIHPTALARAVAHLARGAAAAKHAEASV